MSRINSSTDVTSMDTTEEGSPTSMRVVVRGLSSFAFVNGFNRIRIFTESYVKASVTQIAEVLRGFPGERKISRKQEMRLTANDPLEDSDGIETVTRYSGSSPRGSTKSQKRNAKRRANLAPKKAAATSELLLEEQTKMEYIKVHMAPSRLGRFDSDLRFAKPDPAVAEYLETESGHVPGFDADDYCFMESCGDVQMAHLKMYDHPIQDGPNFSMCERPADAVAALEAAVDHIQDALRLPVKLPRLENMSIRTVDYNPRKSSGVYYKLQGYKKRGDCYERAVLDAEEAMMELLDGEMIPQRPTRIGGRGKMVNMSEQEATVQGVKKGRAIHMTDTRDHLILGLTEQKLNDAWKDPRYPVSVGRGWMHGDASDFIRKFCSHDQFYCFDAEKFDSSLQPWLIHVSILIMREQFEAGLEEEYDAYWHFVEESLLHSFVFRDDGLLYEKFLGTSSGHNHNSLAQSICTTIMSSFHSFYANPTLMTEVVAASFVTEGLGDDNFHAETKLLVKESVEVRGLRNFEVFGVSWLGPKSFTTNSIWEGVVNDDEWEEHRMFGGAQYLGKYFRTLMFKDRDDAVAACAVPYRPWTETILRLLYPEGVSTRRPGDEVIDMHGDGRPERIAGHFIDGFGNPLTRKWLEGLLQFCVQEKGDSAPGYPKKLAERFERMQIKEVDLHINFTQFSFDHWCKLALFKDGRPVPVYVEFDELTM
uniref:RNA-dependent RNA polymerase n=1 Tax=Rhizoctonia cerealis orthocurvulavirus TaxID=3068670 RepID=A0AA51BS82_9VIRU|nr:MAG: RNA-dependent RNA polymerase [Rhizoctonia cerealis orthocurvulavirus]